MIDDPLVATVRNGRLVLDVESDLGEGTQVLLHRQAPARPAALYCDVLLFVATETEREALRQVAGRLELPVSDVSGRMSDYLDLGQVHPNYRVFAVETEMGALRTGGSATKGILCPFETSARHIVAVGMAFGVDRERQNLGDVLVASHVIPYDSVIVDTDKDGRLPTVRYHNTKPTPTNPAFRDLLRRYTDQNPSGFQVHFGAMLSGSAQIRCRAYRDHLVAKLNKRLTDLHNEHRKKGRALAERVVGGEMEGVGLLAAPLMEGAVQWLIVKGISDFADEDHGGDSKSNRRLACENAIELVLKAIKSAPLPENRSETRR
jgi:adenosylhomocysteine nucleosidase